MKKTVETIDVEPFQQLLKEAQEAYRQDASYAIAVSNAARAIESKRAVWAKRVAQREAEKQEKDFNAGQT